jgi:DNA-directed RNA polymerase specialized sigma subunit
MPKTQFSAPRGMPSILGDVPAPFSGQTTHGASADFDTVYPQWQQTATPEMNTKILGTVQPIIDTALNSYVGANASPVIKTRAKLMALSALQSYDPQKGNVKTHLLSQMHRLRRLAAKEQNIISLPEQVGLDFQRLAQIENELRDDLSRDPTDDEIADASGLSTRRIKKIRSFHQPVAAGMAANTDVASTLPNYTKSTDAWLDFVYGDLTPTDKLIMDLTLGRNGRRQTTTQDIARRLNISPGAVSQRAAKIQNMIDRRYTHNF